MRVTEVLARCPEQRMAVPVVPEIGFPRIALP